ncbi:MAG TPA: response regulator transcription factor [Puia sp.]|jgi:two-component system invasion response regulator UvrY|nr:response regulator transcription factor [Puia sp.]
MIRILLADDFTIIRKGVRQILTQAYPHAEIEEIEDGEEWADKLKNSPWDMIISDLRGPDKGGWAALQQFRLDYPDLPVLILSLYKDQHHFQSLDSGPAGYLGKDAAPDELVWAVGQILAGKKNLSIPSKDN